jgi:hypothetical protein
MHYKNIYIRGHHAAIIDFALYIKIVVELETNGTVGTVPS